MLPHLTTAVSLRVFALQQELQKHRVHVVLVYGRVRFRTRFVDGRRLFFAAALARGLALGFGAAALGATFGAAFGVESVVLVARALWVLGLLRGALLSQSPLWALGLVLLLLSLRAQQSVLLLPLLLGPILVGLLILRISPFIFAYII